MASAPWIFLTDVGSATPTSELSADQPIALSTPLERPSLVLPALYLPAHAFDTPNRLSPGQLAIEHPPFGRTTSLKILCHLSRPVSLTLTPSLAQVVSLVVWLLLRTIDRVRDN